MARSCHRRRRCVVQFLLALDILSARIRNPCTKIYFSVINVHSFYDPRREYAKESVSMKLNQSSTVSRLFLGRLSGNEKREREKWRISLTMAKISTVKFYRGFRETIGHMAVICVYFTRRHTLRFFNSVHSFVPPSLLGEESFFHETRLDLSQLVRIFLLVFRMAARPPANH